MDFLPISLRVAGRSIVVIGGGKVAAQKLRTLTSTSAKITVYAKKVCDEIKAMRCVWEERHYESSLINDAFLIYACTNDRSTNHQIAHDAHAHGILVNVADDPEVCDFISPAIWFKKPMSVAVGSDATDARRSVAWRNAIQKWGEHDTTLQ